MFACRTLTVSGRSTPARKAIISAAVGDDWMGPYVIRRGALKFATSELDMFNSEDFKLYLIQTFLPFFIFCVLKEKDMW